ncbi:CoA pyrophosphatase [soil metagenome]
MKALDFFSFLERRLQYPLPGRAAHAEFVPNYADTRIRLSPPPATARRSAVLLPLLRRPNAALPDVLLTVRSETLNSHKGQISFPGGRVDEMEDPCDAALRELEEEVGVPVHDVVVLGALTDLYVPPSNSAIIPFVALVREPAAYVISEHEVQEVFTVPLEYFVETGNIRSAPRTLNGDTVSVPYWDVHHHVHLWGATAMILNELIWIVREYTQD